METMQEEEMRARLPSSHQDLCLSLVAALGDGEMLKCQNPVTRRDQDLKASRSSTQILHVGRQA